MSYAPAVRRPWGMKPVICLGVAGPEVDRRLGVKNPGMSWTGGTRAPWSVPRTHVVWSTIYRVP
jgi:hypothetical protein